MKRLYFALQVLILGMTLFGCTDKEIVDEGQGSIYGVVTDFATGEPIANANVQLRPSGETTLTGYDGMYEFLDIQEGKFSITVSKAEYTDLIDDYVISVKNGRRMRRDVQIKKMPTYIRLTDMVGNDISSLDFGSDVSTNILSFNIYNNSTAKITCQVTKSCDWITLVSPESCSISPGQNVMITVQIDRSKLDAGNNEEYLYVTSNNGSNVLKIIAIGEEVLPNVLTLPVTRPDGTINQWCNTFHAKVTTLGNPAYYKRGFCFSSTKSIPTIDDNRIDVTGTGLGEYSYTYWDFPPQTITYYVRAWVMYGSNNKIQYGNVVSFTYNDL